MKKFVTTFLLTVLTAVGVCAFTACGGNDEKETVYTVTEEEWKSAMVSISGGETSLKCTYTEESEYGKGVVLLDYDSANKVLRVNNKAYEEYETEYYLWVDGDKAYETDSTKELKVLDMEGYKNTLDQNITYYAGGYLFEYGNLSDKFGEFIYNAETKEYTDTINVENFDVEFRLKFENGKLVKLYAGQEGEKYTCEYTYGVTVTVPDDVKSLIK